MHSHQMTNSNDIGAHEKPSSIAAKLEQTIVAVGEESIALTAQEKAEEVRIANLQESFGGINVNPVSGGMIKGASKTEPRMLNRCQTPRRWTAILKLFRIWLDRGERRMAGRMDLVSSWLSRLAENPPTQDREGQPNLFLQYRLGS